MKVTLPDGSVRAFPRGATLDAIARAYDPRLARDDVYAAASRGDVAEPVAEHAELGGSSNVRQRFEAGVPAMRHLLKSGRGPQWRQP